MKNRDSIYIYEFADRVAKAVLQPTDPIEVLIDFLDSDSNNFLDRASKPHKWTLLHVFIQNLNFSDFEWLTGHVVDEAINEIMLFLKSSHISPPEWLSAGTVNSHIYELDEILKEACSYFTEPTFSILFGDKEFLFEFQRLVSIRLQNVSKSIRPDIFKRDGVLKRPTYLPSWLKTAVFHRDKGKCQFCKKDLTGVIDVVNDLRLDHIWPIGKSGSNDATNFQLLCDACNIKKGVDIEGTNYNSFRYW